MKPKAENDTFEVSLYIGCNKGYGGEEFTEDTLVFAIGAFQKTRKEADWTPVRVTPTRFVSGSYNERGWGVTAIKYPRFPKEEKAISAFMNDMAVYLLGLFEQNRISVVHPDKTVIFESPGAQEKV